MKQSTDLHLFGLQYYCNISILVKTHQNTLGVWFHHDNLVFLSQSCLPKGTGVYTDNFWATLMYSLQHGSHMREDKEPVLLSGISGH